MRKVTTLLFFLLIANLCFASDKVIISQWLSAGPFDLAKPVFYDVPNTQGDVFKESQFLTFEQVDIAELFPEESQNFIWSGNKKSVWSKQFSDENGYVKLVNDNNDWQISYAAAYVSTDRWLSANLEIKSPQMLSVYVNGVRLGSKNTIEKEEGKIGKFSKKIELERGKHLIIVKTIFRPEDNDSIKEWKFSASIEVTEPFSTGNLSLSLNPENIKNINHIMDGIKISRISLSPDAKYYIANYSRSLPPSDRSESWAEIKTLKDKKLIHSFRNASISEIKWLPKTNRLSYVSRRDSKATLYLHDLEKNTIEILFAEIENFKGYTWSPDESYLIYFVEEEAPAEDSAIRQVIGMRDRIPGHRNRTYLYKFDIQSKVKTRLTYGNLTSSLMDISPDASKLLISQTRYEYTERPFSFQDVFIMNLKDFSVDTLYVNKNWSISASFSPDGKKLIATGGPSAFDGIGLNLPQGKIPNDYDTQAYIVDISDKSVTPITKKFNPSISDAHWSSVDNRIYLSVSEEDYRRIYVYDLNKKTFSLLNTGYDITDRINYSSRSLKATFAGNNTNFPSQFNVIDLKTAKVSVLEDPESYNYRHVKLGKTYNWDFETQQETTIKGRVYLPPDFDEEEKYPVIVYYYAGTTPVIRSFGGRYPFNLWAGNGYIVYVMQPSGAIGFGQEFSAAHVNNWGATVVDEIIEGTKKFLDAHPFANAEKVGCAGASYGGFMTMLLITRTDIFAAAISHAGISSISSYWGEGYWGYAYSAIATANSFPWNNKDIYIGQSPLFFADRITTPLLLITGDSDTNVPPGESFQMYTALKILNKPVELVLIKGEDHHIVRYGKRIKWHNTIMAYWDMMLKNQPEYWKSLFPEKNY
ncbi:MAG: S9 family peptidase [Desulfobulbaceae bacterium]|nr:S9 family peptidase [Desulfobulbaceae bacterium]